jgi:radical SAM superfamily enzyme YgiQ (UPF0313 family)
MQSGILSAEHEVAVLDALIERINDAVALEKIRKFKPDCIVFITGISSWLEDFIFMQKAKEITGAVLIGSGGVLRERCKEIMEQHPFLDAVLMDFTSDSLLGYLKGKEDLYDICLRRGDEIVLKPPQKLKEFSVPVPLHELFPLNKYRIPHGRQRPFTSMLTNYGCPYQCSYCIAERLDFKYRPWENIVPELEKLDCLGIREIFFKDFTFGIPAGVARRICEEMISRFHGFSWVCASRVNVLDEDMLKLMKRAGCHTIQFGVESASQQILDHNNKDVRVEEIVSMFELCSRLRIKTLAHFVLGLPGETEETLKQTIELAKKIRCDYASFNVAIPLPGTTLRERCLENGWLAGEEEELDPSRGYPVIETSLLSREKLWKLRNYAIYSFYLRPSYILRMLANVRSPQDLIDLCKQGVSLLSN